MHSSEARPKACTEHTKRECAHKRCFLRFHAVLYKKCLVVFPRNDLLAFVAKLLSPYRDFSPASAIPCETPVP